MEVDERTLTPATVVSPRRVDLCWNFDIIPIESNVRVEDLTLNPEISNPKEASIRGGGGGNAKLQWDSLSEKERSVFVKRMSRVAIANMAKGSAFVKKDELREVALGDMGRFFSYCLTEANFLLKRVFNLQLVESPVILSKQQQKAQYSSRYLLRNLFEGELLSRIFRHTLHEQEWAAVKLVILSLVFVHGGFLGEEELKHYMVRFGLLPPRETLATYIPNHSFGTGDEILAKLERQAYLVKGKSQRDLRLGGNDVIPGDPNFEYQWGPRALNEYDNVAIYQFIGEIMGKDDADFKADVMRVCGAAWQAFENPQT